MEKFKDLKTYISNKKDNLIEYIKEKRNVLADKSGKAVSSVSSFLKNNRDKFVKTGVALGLVGTMFLTGCGVQVNKQTGEITSFGNHVGYKDVNQNQHNDGAIIEDVTNKQNNINNNQNDGAIIEDVTNKSNSNSSSDGTIIDIEIIENKKPVSTGNSKEFSDDSAIIEVVDKNQATSGSGQVVGSQNNKPSNNKTETEPTYKDIIVVDPKSESESSKDDIKPEEPFDDGAIIEIVG